MPNTPFKFEQALKELEEITLWFESADVDLDQGLVKFERGMELAGQLKTHLQTVENRVEKIKEKFQPGSTSVAPEDPDQAPGEDQTDLFAA